MTRLSDGTVARLRELTDAPDLTGTRYTLVREIARGGMGVIYEAEDQELQRRVALKVLAPELGASDAVERLRREATTIARLDHPGIVPVHDAGILPDGRAFYAMKLVRGVTLSDYARQGHGQTDLLRAFLRACEAVAFAHAHGVVHRDLKPDNLMVGPFGEVLVMDWGVARVIGAEESEASVVVGTRGYMAPEQERGESARADERSDVYALGVILDALIRAASARGDRPLRSIASKAMQSTPGQRYANAKDLADEIVRYLDGDRVTAHREGPLERTGRLLSKHRALVALVVAYLVMRAVVLLWARI